MVPFPSGAASVIRRGDTAVSVLGVSGVRDSVGCHVQAPGLQGHTLVDLGCVCVLGSPGSTAPALWGVGPLIGNHLEKPPSSSQNFANELPGQGG